MRHLLVLLLISGIVQAAEKFQVVSADPTRFNLSTNPGSALDANEGRGGPEYECRISAFVGSGISYDGGGVERIYISFRFRHVATGQIVDGGDATFSTWNAAQSLPYFTHLRVRVSVQATHGTVLLNGILIDPETGYNQFFTPLTPGYLGTDSCKITFFTFDGTTQTESPTGIERPIEFAIVNSIPKLIIEASPTKIVPGQTVAIFSTTSDADGHAVTVSYDYGDGSVGTSPSHTYSTPGVYTLTVSANDGFDTVTQSITIEVTDDAAQVPVPRFTTSDVVGFVGVPLGFDAFYSTDPQNAIASYSWNFGDGSPAGSGQLISKVYATPGTYTVTLTIRDGEGIQASTQRLIEILPADQIGLFNAFVEFKTAFDRTKTAKDSITLKARLNVGDSQIGDGSAVALEVAGQRFAAALDRKLRAAVKVAPKQTWKVQFATRKQSAGQVDVQVTIKNADLGLGFNQLGAVAGGVGSASIIVPVRLEVGAYSFEIPCDTDFEFSKAGTKAKGEGASE